MFLKLYPAVMTVLFLLIMQYLKVSVITLYNHFPPYGVEDNIKANKLVEKLSSISLHLSFGTAQSIYEQFKWIFLLSFTIVEKHIKTTGKVQ